MIKVLSIDGGGIRGIISAIVLAEIERRTERPISELFDLIAGTSAGGILALGLTMPSPDRQPKYKAEELIGLFEEKGQQIFARPFGDKIHRFWSLIGAKYSSRGIEGVLDEYFDQARLKDALTDIIVPSYEIERRMPFFFKSRKARKNKNYDFSLSQVARATSAAPTYFKPARIQTEITYQHYTLVDGGVFANNPTLCAYAEARWMQENDLLPRTSVDEFLVTSVGSGELNRPLYYEESKGWGVRDWARPILGIVFQGVGDTVDYQMKQLLPPRERYYRFQDVLLEGNDDLDDASTENIRALKRLARVILDKNDEGLERLCEELTL